MSIVSHTKRRTAELLDITKRFEQLRRRKESLESLIAAISPILGLEAAAKPSAAAAKQPVPGEAQPLENQQLTHLIRYLCRSPKQKRPGAILSRGGSGTRLN